MSASKSVAAPKAEPKIIYQRFFKSVGPRTYAAQIKECSNGNQLLVLTEGKRDEKTNEVRKTRLFIYAEDFAEYYRMLHDAEKFINANPLPADVRKRRENYWRREPNKNPNESRRASAAK